MLLLAFLDLAQLPLLVSGEPLIKANLCSTSGTPSVLSFSLPSFSPIQPEQKVCRVTITHTEARPLQATLHRCKRLVTVTSWGVFQDCDFTYLATLPRKGCVQVETYPQDPCDDWWYAGDHPYIWKLSAQRFKCEFCLCLPITEATVSFLPHPPRLYCSFDDCSVCSPTDLTSGVCVLSSGTEITFVPPVINDEYEELEVIGKLFYNPRHVMIDTLHASYTLDENFLFRDDKFKVSCRTRTKRDTEQEYTDDQLRPLLRVLNDAAHMVHRLLTTLLSQPLTDMSAFAQQILGIKNIIGVVNKGLVLYWECQPVPVELLPWANDTLYPPVLFNNQTYYMNPYTQNLYATSPLVSSGMYVIIAQPSSYYLGSTGSGMIPKKIQASGHYLNLTSPLEGLDALNDLRTHVHLSDPLSIAVRSTFDRDAFKHEVLSQASDYAALLSVGFSSILLFLVKAYNFYKYGRFARALPPISGDQY
ncbi:uncharacterized protein LOC120990771 [Bufo bufo]|uniref:uncharacterized protein LOC120990771 n=1 Tax=Bufo bufo TaxID=8384 RepID=UPI001ABE6B9C|nr:uncharacterized protein LOC120990771 [Bufo bufo]